LKSLPADLHYAQVLDMKNRARNIKLVVIIASLFLGGCAASLKSIDGETSFAGFRSRGKIAAAIEDRSFALWVQPTWDYNYQAVDSLDPEDMQPSAASEYNLMYHLYGPDYRYPYGNRMWSQHRRRHYDLPWGYGYGYDPFYDPYYYDPYWGMNYRQSWRYNSWTDPYFDFYFHDPFSYSHYYSYQFDPIYWGRSRYYGTGSGYTYANASKAKSTKQRRLRGRGDSRYVREPNPASAAGASNVKVRSTNTGGSKSSTGVRVKSTGNSSSSGKSSGTKSSSKQQQRRKRGRDD